jgi:predicted transcriptional regulator
MSAVPSTTITATTTTTITLHDEIAAAVRHLAALDRHGALVPLPALHRELARRGVAVPHHQLAAVLLDLERARRVELRIAQSPARLDPEERRHGIPRPGRGLLFYVMPTDERYG